MAANRVVLAFSGNWLRPQPCLHRREGVPHSHHAFVANDRQRATGLAENRLLHRNQLEVLPDDRTVQLLASSSNWLRPQPCLHRRAGVPPNQRAALPLNRVVLAFSGNWNCPIESLQRRAGVPRNQAAVLAGNRVVVTFSGNWLRPQPCLHRREGVPRNHRAALRGNRIVLAFTNWLRLQPCLHLRAGVHHSQHAFVPMKWSVRRTSCLTNALCSC